MDQIGFVKRIVGSEMELEIRRISACGGGCSSCGGSCENVSHIITLPNELDAEVGDLVEIEGQAKNILKYTAVVYILPLVFLVIGVILGNTIFKSRGYVNYEILSFFTGVVFLGISLILVKIIDKNIANKKDSTLSVTRIL